MATADRPEQQRQPRRDQRAEREHENHQGDRQRQELGLAEVVLERLRQRLVRARVAELLDPQPRVRAIEPGHRGEDRADALLRGVRVAPDVELNQRRPAIARDLALVLAGKRRLDVGDRREPASPATTSRIAASNSGSLTVSPDALDWTSTSSLARWLNPASARIWSARRDSPVPRSSSARCCVPTAPPMKTHATTSASHPKIATRRCSALQRPARWARFGRDGIKLAFPALPRTVGGGRPD